MTALQNYERTKGTVWVARQTRVTARCPTPEEEHAGITEVVIARRDVSRVPLPGRNPEESRNARSVHYCVNRLSRQKGPHPLGRWEKWTRFTCWRHHDPRGSLLTAKKHLRAKASLMRSNAVSCFLRSPTGADTVSGHAYQGRT